MYKLSLVALLSAALVGCGESSSPAPVAKAGTASPASSVDQKGQGQAAAAVAERFLSAVLSGDSQSAVALLTTKAAQQHAEDPSTLAAMGLQVDKLEVAEALLLDDDEAAVACLLTEPGAAAPAELCCLLKRETAGWRVCGVASEAEDGSPAVISFEGTPADPEQDLSQLVKEGTNPQSEKTASAPTDRTTR